MPTQIRFQPTLFIFMGTSSGQIGWRLKKLLHQSYGDVPVLRFLWIDIDSDIQPNAQEWFSKDERIELSGLDPAAVIANVDNYPTIKEWWPGTSVPAGMLAGGGSPQQMRLVGRLALFRMFNDRTRGPAFVDKLTSAINALSEISNIKNTEAKSTDKVQYSVEKGCRVVLFFSPCGGTGSALSFDVAYNCRKFLEDKNPTIVSIGILPGVVDEAIKNETNTQRQKVRANAYAWFKEDDMLTEHPYWNVTYPEGAPVIVHAPPIQYKYIVDIQNQAGYRLNSAEDVYNMIAQALFMDTGSSVAGAMRGFTANVAALGELFEGKQRTFSSLAAASLIFPKERLSNYCSHRLTHQFLSEGFLGAPDEHQVTIEASTLLTSLRLRDADLLPDLIASSKIKMQYEASIRKADSVSAAISQIDAQETQNVEARQSETLKINQFSQKYLEAKKKEFDLGIAKISAQHGLRFALAVLNRLLEPAPSGMVDTSVISLDGMKTRILQQGVTEADKETARKDYEKAHGSLSRLDDGIEDKIERMLDMRGWKKKLMLYKNACLTAMAKVNEISMQLAAQQNASNLYDQLASFAGSIKASLEASASTVDTLAAEIKKITDNQASKDQAESGSYEFRQEIEVDFPGYYAENSGGIKPAAVFQGMIPASATGSIEAFCKWIAAEIKPASLEYAAHYFTQALESASLLEILKANAEKKKVDPKKYIEAQLSGLVEYCQPFWSFNQNRGLHDMEGKSMIGIEDESSPLISDTFRDGTQYELKTTGFRDRIDVVRFQHGLPAFLIRGMDEFKLVYEQKRKGKDPLHILPGAESAKDLMPEQGKRNREMFAVAIGFGYIVKSGSFYYFDPDRNYRDHNIPPARDYKLAQGRDKAEEEFSRHEDWISQVEEKVEDEVKQIGNDAAIKKLDELIEAHRVSIAKSNHDEAVRKQYEKEIEAFKAMQHRLSKAG